MNNQQKLTLLKAIGCLILFIAVGYSSYDVAKGNMRLERSLNENVSPPQRDFRPESSRRERAPSPSGTPAQPATRAASRTTIHRANAPDTFNDRYDDFLSDPEDEINYPSEVFDSQMDEEESEYVEREMDY